MSNWIKQLDELDRQLGDLFAEAGKYDNARLLQQPGPGRWSAIQVMQHLMLSEGGSLQYLRKKTSSGVSGIGKTGFSATFRKWLLKAYLALPFKFKAPKVVAEESFPPVSGLEEVRSNWLKIRSDLRAFMGALPQEAHTREVYRHPIAGRMDISGMFDFFQSHFSRHRQQIERTLKEVGSRD